MTRALVRKELREHGWVVILLWVACALILLLHLVKAKEGGSPIVAFQRLVTSFGPLLSLALANRLVVREYGGRTQLFLETLRVSRGRVIAVKWLLGAALIVLTITACLAATAAWSSAQVQLTPRFLLLLASRGFSFLLWFYAIAFLFGLLGRYRFLAWGALLIGAYALGTYAQLPLPHYPPFHLASESMAFQKMDVPWSDLLWTWAITLGLLAGSFGLAVAGEGSLGAFLARRMTHREKVVVAAVALIPIGFLGVLDMRKTKPAFHLEEAILAKRSGVHVGVARTRRVKDTEATALAEAIASDLAELREELGLKVSPAVYVLPDASLDGNLFLRAELPASDGVVVRGALGSEFFQTEEFRAFVVREVLEWYTRGRADREERRWLLDGFSQWWVARRSPRLEDRLKLRAVEASKRMQPDADALRSWLTAREQIGDCLGDALAWRAVSILARETGAKRLRDLLGDAWGDRPPDDARAPFLEEPLERLLSTHANVTLPGLMTKVSDAFEEDGAKIESSGSPTASFEARPMRGRLSEIHYRIDGTGIDPGPFAVLYRTMTPWLGEVDRADLSRVDATGPGVLPLTVERGALLFTAAEVWDASLQCSVRVGARRWAVR